MKGKLIGRGQYIKLLKMQLNEIIKNLQETEYKQQIDELAVRYSGVDLIERALNKNLADTLTKLRRISDPHVHDLISAYVKRWDIHDLKTVLRGIVSKADKNYVQSLLISAGSLTSEKLMKLFDLQDVSEVLKSTPFIQQKRFDKVDNLFDTENELDRVYYGELHDLAGRLSGLGKPVATFLENEVDTLNIKTLLRLKRKEFQKHDILKYMIPGSLKKNFLEKLISGDPGELLAGTPYGPCIHESLAETELELDQLLIKKSFLSVHQTPLTVTAIMSYLLVKEIEVRNIKAIVKAKQLGIDDTFIEQKLVV